MENENDNEIDNDSEVNSLPVQTGPLTQKERVVRSLASYYTAAFDAATLAGEWADIIKAQNPSAALEIFCIGSSYPAYKEKEAAIVMVKRVKRHLIRLNLTVLDAFEKRMLADAIAHVIYQDEHFNPGINRQQPDQGEPGWEDRVEAAQARLDEMNAENEAAELPEAI